VCIEAPLATYGRRRVKDGLYASGFLVQVFQFAKTLHPWWFRAAGPVALGRQSVAQRDCDEIVEGLSAPAGSCLRVAQERTGKFERHLHVSSLPFDEQLVFSVDPSGSES
jgi:hypothetical protein